MSSTVITKKGFVKAFGAISFNIDSRYCISLIDNFNKIESSQRYTSALFFIKEYNGEKIGIDMVFIEQVYALYEALTSKKIEKI